MTSLEPNETDTLVPGTETGPAAGLLKSRLNNIEGWGEFTNLAMNSLYEFLVDQNVNEDHLARSSIT